MKQTNTRNSERWFFPITTSMALIIALCFTATNTYAKKKKDGGFTQSGYRRGRGAAGDGIAGSPKSDSKSGGFSQGGYRRGRGAAGDGIAGSSNSKGDGRGSIHHSNLSYHGQSGSYSSSPFYRRRGKKRHYGSVRHSGY